MYNKLNVFDYKEMTNVIKPVIITRTTPDGFKFKYRFYVIIIIRSFYIKGVQIY